MRAKTYLLGCAAALALAACGKKEAESDSAASAETIAEDTVDTAAADAETNEIMPIASPDPAVADANLAESEKFLAENGGREGVTTLPSGLQYEVLEEGPDGGYSPVATDLVDVHYVGTLIDGTEFDSSRARGAAARFPLNQVIAGWTEGVQHMSEGDRYRLYLPPELAYGESGTPGGPIGPNEALIFDVELIKVSSPERNLKTAEEFLAENGKRAGVNTTESGLQYEVLAEGPADGKSPTDADIVKVHYRGTLIDGTEFDSSYARNEPVEFPLAQVIAGWTEGVQLMSEGDKFKFFIPPHLAYGETGTPGGPIGPNEALIFDVELLEVK